MKKHGHYCKVCGEYKANEKFSGKGHAAHICKSCASLSPEKQAEQMTVNRLLNLPWRLSKEQISWLKNRMKDKPGSSCTGKRTIRDEVSSEAVRGHRGRFYRIAKAVCTMQAVSFLERRPFYGNLTHHAPAYRQGAH